MNAIFLNLEKNWHAILIFKNRIQVVLKRLWHPEFKILLLATSEGQIEVKIRPDMPSFNVLTRIKPYNTVNINKSMNRLNSEKFQNCHFEPKLSFSSENHKNFSLNEFPEFYLSTLYIIFQNFHENSHYVNCHFRRNFENHI